MLEHAQLDNRRGIDWTSISWGDRNTKDIKKNRSREDVGCNYHLGRSGGRNEGE